MLLTELEFTVFVLKYQNHFEFPKNGKESPRLKILKIPGGGEGHQRPPWNGKSWGVGGANQRVFRGGGMDIFWNHTLMKEASFTYKIITT